jgi:hypothetical protein
MKTKGYRQSNLGYWAKNGRWGFYVILGMLVLISVVDQSVDSGRVLLVLRWQLAVKSTVRGDTMGIPHRREGETWSGGWISTILSSKQRGDIGHPYHVLHRILMIRSWREGPPTKGSGQEVAKQSFWLLIPNVGLVELRRWRSSELGFWCFKGREWGHSSVTPRVMKSLIHILRPLIK